MIYNPGNCQKPDKNRQSTKYDDGARDNSGCVDATDELGSGRQGYYLVDTPLRVPPNTARVTPHPIQTQSALLTSAITWYSWLVDDDPQTLVPFVLFLKTFLTVRLSAGPNTDDNYWA